MTRKSVRNEQEDLLNATPYPRVLGYTVRTHQINNFTVHINEDIIEPSYYAKVFEMLLDANEADVVSFFIASGGGRVDGLNVLLEGIRMTEATTVAVLIGECHSSASVLALNCDEVIVTDSAEALIHSCSFGIRGKAADVAAHVAHTLKVTEKLDRQTYSGFLSEHELELMIAGKEYYFDADEIRQRVQQRLEYLTKKAEAEIPVEEETIPSPKKSKKEQ